MDWNELIEQTIEYYQPNASEAEDDSTSSKFSPRSLPTITQEDWDEIVAQLGIDPGAFLKQLYLRVGGGCIGPGYGTLPAVPADSRFHNLLEYNLAVFRYDKKHWPNGLLALIDWGCCIISCIDCTTEQLQVVRFDPNISSPDPDSGSIWDSRFSLESESLHEWWTKWLAGEDLWNQNRSFPRWPRYTKFLNEKRRLKVASNQLKLDLMFD